MNRPQEEIFQDTPWTRAVALAVREFFTLERGRKIAEYLRRSNQQELVVSIPGHVMHVTVHGNTAKLDPDTMSALGDKPTKLSATQVIELVNRLRKALGLD